MYRYNVSKHTSSQFYSYSTKSRTIASRCFITTFITKIEIKVQQSDSCQGARTSESVCDMICGGLTAAAQLALLWCLPQANTTIQIKVITKQKTETNMTQPWGFSGTTSVHATKIHTRPPKTCNNMYTSCIHEKSWNTCEKSPQGLRSP